MGNPNGLGGGLQIRAPRLSLFSRLFGAFLAILLLTLVVLGVLLTHFLANFFAVTRERFLIRQGERIALTVEAAELGRIGRADLLNRLRLIRKQAGGDFEIRGPDGRTLLAMPAGFHPSAQILGELAGGSPPSPRSGVGFPPLAPPAGPPSGGSWGVGLMRRDGYLWLSLPLGDGGTLYLRHGLGNDRLTAGLEHQLILAAILAVVFGALLTAFVSRRITAPLREMSRAAREVAEGRWETPVRVAGPEELARLSESFNEMASHLAEAEAERREFLASVSHELRTPLTSVRGFLQAVLDGTVPPEESRRYLELAFGETNRLGRLIQDLFDLARLEAGAFELRPVALSLPTLVERAAAGMAEPFRRKEIDLEIRVTSLRVLADPDRLTQVLTNLLQNAERYSPRGARVGVEAVARDGMARVTVWDEGPGVKPEERWKIFERFYRGSGSRGAGLGLYLSRRLVEAHGGRIWLEDSGSGARFVFTVPLAD